MQVHGPSVVLKQPQQEIRTMLIDRRFVRLTVGPVEIHVQTAEEADILIAAAVEAKRLLDPPVITGTTDAVPVISEAELTVAITIVSDRLPIENLAPHALARRLLLAAQEPVITDSERTCPETHPDGGLPCHRGGDHGVHRDPDGETWRTDGGESADIAYDRTHPDPYRTWVNGEQPASAS